jgi:hypothetical protein
MTVSTKDFKGQIGKRFRDGLKPLGFKGSGVDLYKETDNFLHSVFLSSSRFGEKFTLGLAVQPKSIKTNSLGKIDFDRLKNTMFEYKIVPWKNASGHWWEYDSSEVTNLKTIEKVIDFVEKHVSQMIKSFEMKPGLLEIVQPKDLSDFHSWFTKQTGATIATTDIRFAWSLAVLFEEIDKERSKSFAKYGIENSDKKIEFFGQGDFERILSKSNGA